MSESVFNVKQLRPVKKSTTKPQKASRGSELIFNKM